jgi:hypothetical protein
LYLIPRGMELAQTFSIQYYQYTTLYTFIREN